MDEQKQMSNREPAQPRGRPILSISRLALLATVIGFAAILLSRSRSYHIEIYDSFGGRIAGPVAHDGNTLFVEIGNRLGQFQFDPDSKEMIEVGRSAEPFNGLGVSDFGATGIEFWGDRVLVRAHDQMNRYPSAQKDFLLHHFHFKDAKNLPRLNQPFRETRPAGTILDVASNESIIAFTSAFLDDAQNIFTYASRLYLSFEQPTGQVEADFNQVLDLEGTARGLAVTPSTILVLQSEREDIERFFVTVYPIQNRGDGSPYVNSLDSIKIPIDQDGPRELGQPVKIVSGNNQAFVLGQGGSIRTIDLGDLNATGISNGLAGPYWASESRNVLSAGTDGKVLYMLLENGVPERYSVLPEKPHELRAYTIKDPSRPRLLWKQPVSPDLEHISIFNQDLILTGNHRANRIVVHSIDAGPDNQSTVYEPKEVLNFEIIDEYILIMTKAHGLLRATLDGEHQIHVDPEPWITGEVSDILRAGDLLAVLRPSGEIELVDPDRPRESLSKISIGEAIGRRYRIFTEGNISLVGEDDPALDQAYIGRMEFDDRRENKSVSSLDDLMANNFEDWKTQFRDMPKLLAASDSYLVVGSSERPWLPRKTKREDLDNNMTRYVDAYVIDIRDPEEPALIGMLEELGAVQNAVVYEGKLYLSSRNQGETSLFVYQMDGESPLVPVADHPIDHNTKLALHERHGYVIAHGRAQDDMLGLRLDDHSRLDSLEYYFQDRLENESIRFGLDILPTKNWIWTTDPLTLHRPRNSSSTKPVATYPKAFFELIRPYNEQIAIGFQEDVGLYVFGIERGPYLGFLNSEGDED